jgi:hypothetical protein
MEQYSLNLTVEEINKILTSLSQMPYVQVFELIEKIKSQTQAQIQAQEVRDSQTLDSDVTELVDKS